MKEDLIKVEPSSRARFLTIVLPILACSIIDAFPVPSLRKFGTCDKTEEFFFIQCFSLLIILIQRIF